VPRWLTEGISVFEERRARPDWGREMEVQFAEAMNRDAVTPVAELDGAFSRAESIGLAYYQSSLLVELIVEKWGDAGLQRLLRAYGEGLDNDGALERALATTPSDLDALFAAAAERRFGAVRTALEWPDTDGAARGTLDELRAMAEQHPTSYPVLIVLGDALQRAGEVDAAIGVYERAAALVPAMTGEEGPLARMAALAEQAGNLDRQIWALDRIIERDHTNVDAARRLIALLDPERDRARWLRAHARVVELDPFDSGAHSVLGREALAAGDLEGARRSLAVAVATGPKDPVSAHCDLAEVFVALGARAEAKRETLAALEIAPTYARAQDLLLAIVDGRP
jgi:tetratricopeptide (TPR) repeat protein